MAKKIALSRVLICDDSFETRTALKTLFSVEGFDVIEAQDGLIGEELAKKHHPDLIIMDIIMPRQDGITTIRKLKENSQTKDIPIIIITGKAGVTQLLGEEAELVEAVFEKPFPLKELRKKIEEIFQ